MIPNLKFWIPMVVFQIVFGLTIFTITRQYYIQDSDNVGNDSTEIRQPAFVWPDGVTQMDSTQLDSSTFGRSSIEDPAELARQANEFFTKGQYDKAADSYQQLLILRPNNVNTYNNLGITLHYLGRSTEALRRLNEGVAIDPTHQRIWLTLGYVNSQTGSTEKARNALTTAVNIDASNEIGKSAAEMLENLP
ncbi:MAG: tetratricopeptide repeat protein [Gammaproteobacteria bacterium]|nr:MAG: tetratricopeptide repeat protein [Gammaproteobacteria bacterium]